MKASITFAAAALPLVAIAGPIAARSNTCVALGCYTDAVSFRALRVNTQVAGGPSSQSPDACTAACIAHGLPFAGVEYGHECWCGSSIANGQALSTDPSICNMPCTGAPGEICGGPGAINIYDCTASLPVPPSYNSCKPLGCYTDSVSHRTLLTNVQVPGGFSHQTPDLCTAACIAAGFRYAGNEYGGECWCGNTLDNGGAPAPDGNEQCQMQCKGDASLFCGGPDRLTLYDCAPPSPTACSNPGTCHHYDIIFDPSCTNGACACGLDTDGAGVCFQSSFCFDSCTSNADCGEGRACLTQSCCLGNTCVATSSICANPARKMIRAAERLNKKANVKKDECIPTAIIPCD